MNCLSREPDLRPSASDIKYYLNTTVADALQEISENEFQQNRKNWKLEFQRIYGASSGNADGPPDRSPSGSGPHRGPAPPGAPAGRRESGSGHAGPPGTSGHDGTPGSGGNGGTDLIQAAEIVRTTDNDENNRRRSLRKFSSSNSIMAARISCSVKLRPAVQYAKRPVVASSESEAVNVACKSSTETSHSAEPCFRRKSDRLRIQSKQIIARANAPHRRINTRQLRPKPRKLLRQQLDLTTCQICGKKFKCAAFLRFHKRTHSNARPFVCQTCGKAFKWKHTLKQHTFLHSGEKLHACAVCEKSFTTSAARRNHELRVHANSRRFKCQACPRRFNAKQDLLRHQLTHTGEKPHACAWCGVRYRQISALIVHQRRHTGERPYSCCWCVARFRDSTTLIAHQRLHTGERPYRCEACSLDFVGRGSLWQHNKSVHENQQ